MTIAVPPGNDRYPATAFSNLTYSFNYLRGNATKKASGCTAPLQASSVVGDSTNSFCINPKQDRALVAVFQRSRNDKLPSFAFIETGYARNDEHPGSGNSVLVGQAEVAKVVNAFMASPAWNDSVFFFSYDEGGGPYDHVPPVAGHSNDFTDASLGAVPDISTIAVNPDAISLAIRPGARQPPIATFIPISLGSTQGMRRPFTALTHNLVSACRTS